GGLGGPLGRASRRAGRRGRAVRRARRLAARRPLELRHLRRARHRALPLQRRPRRRGGRAGRLPGRALSHGPAVVGHPRARQARHPQPERAHRAGTRRAARLGPDLPAAVRGRKAGRTVTASDTRPSSAAANPAEAQARYRPLILDENVPDDLAVLARLRATPTVAIRDLRDAIRAELAKLCEPPIDPGDLADERWVYYPWRRTLLG